MFLSSQPFSSGLCRLLQKPRVLPCLLAKRDKWLLMLPLVEQLRYHSSLLLLSLLADGVSWLPRLSEAMAVFWAKDWASLHSSALATSSKGVQCPSGEGMLHCSTPIPPVIDNSICFLFCSCVLALFVSGKIVGYLTIHCY